MLSLLKTTAALLLIMLVNAINSVREIYNNHLSGKLLSLFPFNLTYLSHFAIEKTNKLEMILFLAVANNFLCVNMSALS